MIRGFDLVPLACIIAASASAGDANAGSEAGGDYHKYGPTRRRLLTYFSKYAGDDSNYTQQGGGLRGGDYKEYMSQYASDYSKYILGGTDQQAASQQPQQLPADIAGGDAVIGSGQQGGTSVPRPYRTFGAGAVEQEYSENKSRIEQEMAQDKATASSGMLAARTKASGSDAAAAEADDEENEKKDDSADDAPRADMGDRGTLAASELLVGAAATIGSSSFPLDAGGENGSLTGGQVARRRLGTEGAWSPLGEPRLKTKCYAFHSQHKSGGHTVEMALRGQAKFAAFKGHKYVWRFCDYEQWSWKTMSCRMRPVPTEYRVVQKGYAVSLTHTPEWDQEACVWFTLFRDPVSRLVSSYLYCRNLKTWQDPLCGTCALDAKHATLHQWAVHWGNFLFRELLQYPPIMKDLFPPRGEGGSCDRICEVRKRSPCPRNRMYVLKAALDGGDDPRTPQGSMNLERLFAHLRGGSGVRPMFDFIGVIERWENTTVLWDHMMPLSGKKNWLQLMEGVKATHGSEKYEALEKRTLEAARQDPFVLEQIQGDLRIYREFASPLFEAQWRQVGRR